MVLEPGETDARQDFYDRPHYSDSHVVHELEGRVTELWQKLHRQEAELIALRQENARLRAERDKAEALLGVKRRVEGIAQRSGVPSV